MLTSRKKFLQQAGFAVAGSLIPCYNLLGNAPPPANRKLPVDTTHPSDCSINLINPIYPVAYIQEADFQYHKGNYPGIAKDQLYILEDNEPPGIVGDCLSSLPSSDVCSATNSHAQDISALQYRVYYPRSTYENATNGHNYDEVPIPCIVFFHPGGFAECSDNIQPGIKTICREFARRGFIAFTVGYRTGRIKDTDASRTSAQQGLASYRGMQDGRGAIRSIIKRNALTDKHGNRFKINENQVFIGGLSAGAIIAMGITYYRSQGMINQAFPVRNTSLSVENSLGHINADYYYGETGSDLANPLHTPIIRGILNGWGGIVIPYSYDGGNDFGVSEKTFFQGSGTGNRINPPMIGFVGAQDTVIPCNDNNSLGIGPQNMLFSTANLYRGQSFCLEQTGNYLIKNPTSTNNVFVKQCSTQNMYYILKELDRFTELYVDCDMGHGIDKNKLNTENFGVSASTVDDVYLYMVQRAAVFFQTILQSPPSAAFLPFNHRGRSIFRGLVPNLNTRICTECDGVPSTDVCNVSPDPLCE